MAKNNDIDLWKVISREYFENKIMGKFNDY
jgi:hypothetical protein